MKSKPDYDSKSDSNSNSNDNNIDTKTRKITNIYDIIQIQNENIKNDKNNSYEYIIDKLTSIENKLDLLYDKLNIS